MRKFGVLVLSLIFIISFAKAQVAKDTAARSLVKGDSVIQKSTGSTIDKIAAIVGNSPILLSDIELSYVQYLVSGNAPDPNIKCRILQSLLTQKLLAQQAIVDSVEVKDDDVDANVDRRMRDAIKNAGGQEKLEGFLGRSILQYKDEIRPDIKEAMVAQKMQAKITEKLSVTPLDIKKYYETIPKDSLPTFSKEVEVGEISFEPKLNKEEKQPYKEKAEELLQRVKKGEDFATLARVYSQDPGSAAEGGDYGFIDRNTMVKEFTAWAFKLKAGEISPVFETDYGFHFLQVIERRGEQVHVRHILIIPRITQAALDRTKAKADSIYNLLTLNKKVDFAAAANFYSDNKETKYNGGMMLNAENVDNRTTFIPMDRLDPKIALVVDTMKAGQMAKPIYFAGNGGNVKDSYKILLLKSATNAHKANLEQDYPKLKNYAYGYKENKTVSEWFDKRRKETFIKIDPEYQTCDILQKWVKAITVTSAQVKQ